MDLPTAHTRLKFDFEKLRDPNVLESFQAMIGGKFAPLTIMNYEDTDLDLTITTFNTAVTETASEVLRKHRQKKKAMGCLCVPSPYGDVVSSSNLFYVMHQ